MSGFDDPGVYYSDNFGGGDGHGSEEGGQKKTQLKKRFREFLRQFRVGTDRTGFTYKYRSVHHHYIGYNSAGDVCKERHGYPNRPSTKSTIIK